MSDYKPKDHIYMMPGLAANSRIFENIKIPNRRYQLHKIDWIKPRLNEDLKHYWTYMHRRIHAAIYK